MVLKQQIADSLLSGSKTVSIRVNDNYELFIKKIDNKIIVYHIDCEINTVFDEQSSSNINIEDFASYIVSCIEYNLRRIV